MLLDVDGTLYHQGPLRGRMLIELGTLAFKPGSVPSALRVMRMIHRFRRVREALRDRAPGTERLERLQFTVTAAELGVSAEEVERAVAEWIDRRPLRHLTRYRRAGVCTFLEALRERGVVRGVFSDYPVQDKLRALGLHDHFDVLVEATETSVNAFKPSPPGYLRFCERSGISPTEVLYVGDRPEVDAAGAHSCGMACAILSRARKPSSDSYSVYRSFAELGRAMEL